MSAWIQHIREFAKEKGLSFGCALSDPDCSKTYRMKKEMKKNPITIAEPTENPKLQMKGIEIKRPMSKDVTEIKPKKSKEQEINEMMDEWSKGYTPPVKEKKSKPKKKVELVIEEEPPKPVEPIKAKRVAKKEPPKEIQFILANKALDKWAKDTEDDFYEKKGLDKELKIPWKKFTNIVDKEVNKIGKKYGLPKDWITKDELMRIKFAADLEKEARMRELTTVDEQKKKSKITDGMTTEEMLKKVFVEPFKTKSQIDKQALFLAHTAFEDWTSDTIEDFYNPDMSLKISERKYDKYVSEAIKEIGKKYNLPKGWEDLPKPKI